MKRILQPEFMRSPSAQRTAILLWLGLVAVLCAAVLQGVQVLRS
jgi:hypothetical protein